MELCPDAPGDNDLRPGTWTRRHRSRVVSDRNLAKSIPNNETTATTRLVQCAVTEATTRLRWCPLLLESYHSDHRRPARRSGASGDRRLQERPSPANASGQR